MLTLLLIPQCSWRTRSVIVQVAYRICTSCWGSCTRTMCHCDSESSAQYYCLRRVFTHFILRSRSCRCVRNIESHRPLLEVSTVPPAPSVHYLCCVYVLLCYGSHDQHGVYVFTSCTCRISCDEASNAHFRCTRQMCFRSTFECHIINAKCSYAGLTSDGTF